jgi:hypothetical protein
VLFQLQVYYGYNLSPASLTQRSTPNPLQFDTMKSADRAVIASPPDAARVVVAAGSGPAVAAARERRMG